MDAVYDKFLKEYSGYVRSSKAVSIKKEQLKNVSKEYKEAFSDARLSCDQTRTFDAEKIKNTCILIDGLSTAYLEVGKALKDQSESLRRTADAADAAIDREVDKEDE